MSIMVVSDWKFLLGYKLTRSAPNSKREFCCFMMKMKGITLIMGCSTWYLFSTHFKVFRNIIKGGEIF